MYCAVVLGKTKNLFLCVSHESIERCANNEKKMSETFCILPEPLM